MCVVCYMLCVPCMFVWQSVLCDQEHLFPPLRYGHGSVVSESADVWYMVSRVEYCVAIVLADSAHCVSVVLVRCSMFLTRVASSCRME